SASWSSASTSGASSACRWRSGWRDERAPLAPRPGLAGVSRTVLLRQLRPGHLADQPARRRRQSGVRLGEPPAVLGLEHRALLVDRPALRPVAVPLPEPPGTGSSRPAPAQRAAGGGRLLPALAAALHLHAPGHGRRVRPAVRTPRRLRQTVQPGALAAHRAAGDSLGLLCPACAGAVALAAARLVRADRRFRAHHLAAPFHR